MKVSLRPHWVQRLASAVVFTFVVCTTSDRAMAEVFEAIVGHGISVELPAEWKKLTKLATIPATPLYSKQEQAYIADYRKREKEGKPVEDFPMGLLRKPGDSLPRHIRIRLQNLPEFTFENGTIHIPEITVHRIADYQLIESMNGEPNLRVFPELIKLLFEDDVRKPLQQVPFIPWHTSGGHYHSKRINFRSGKGVRFITRYEWDADVLREGVLAYFYEGITADKKHLVFATFPIKMKGLTGDSHLGYSAKTKEEYQRLVHNGDDYRQKAEVWMHENKDTIQPRLELLDRIMESVSVNEPELGE